MSVARKSVNKKDGNKNSRSRSRKSNRTQKGNNTQLVKEGKQLFFTQFESAMSTAKLSKEQWRILCRMAGVDVDDSETVAELKHNLFVKVQKMSNHWVPNIVLGSVLLVAAWYFVVFFIRLTEGDLAKLGIPIVSKTYRTFYSLLTHIGMKNALQKVDSLQSYKTINQLDMLYILLILLRFSLAYFGSFLVMKGVFKELMPNTDMKTQLLKFINVAHSNEKIQNPHLKCSGKSIFQCAINTSCKIDWSNRKCVSRKSQLYDFQNVA